MARIFPDIHIYVAEYACLCCGQLPPDIYDNQNYYNFFRDWENIREEWGKPIKISKEGGGYRCPKYQYRLIIKKSTKATCSPHFFFALDNDLDSKEEVLKFAEIVEKVHPEMRMGYLGYLDQGKTFVHLDEAYRVRPKPSPTWIEGYRW